MNFKFNKGIQTFLFFILTFFTFMIALANVVVMLRDVNIISIIMSIVLVSDVILLGKIMVGSYNNRSDNNVSEEQD